MDNLQKYLAQKIDEGFDKLIAEGKITPEIIEEWGNEHMRTPYCDNGLLPLNATPRT
jgi:hypothetical protein